MKKVVFIQPFSGQFTAPATWELHAAGFLVNDEGLDGSVQSVKVPVFVTDTARDIENRLIEQTTLVFGVSKHDILITFG